MKRFCQRVVAVAVLLSMMTMSTACYGPFTMTKNVYHWNSTVKGSDPSNEKWTREFVFFGMLVVPVYMFSALLDTFIFNSMHFWTGDSPIKASDIGSDGAKVTTLGETTIRWTSSAVGATATYERNGIVERRVMLVPNLTGYRLVDEHGTLLSEAKYGVDGTVRLLNADGQVVKQWSPDELNSLAGGRSGLRAEVSR